MTEVIVVSLSSGELAFLPIKCGGGVALDRGEEACIYGGADPMEAADWRTEFYAGSDSDVNGFLDGLSTAARFNAPYSLVLSLSGDLFVGEYVGRRVRRIDPQRNVTLLAGSTTDEAGFVDGEGPAARFDVCESLAVENAGYVYVGDSHTIRRISIQTKLVTTVAGRSDISSLVDGPRTPPESFEPSESPTTGSAA